MNSSLSRVKGLVTALSAALESGQQGCQASIAHLRETLRSLQEDTADRRVRQLAQEVQALDARVDGLVCERSRELLAKTTDELEGLEGLLEDAAVGAVARCIQPCTPSTLASFCQRWLEALVDLTGAESGFVLFCRRDSTEAQVAASHGPAGRDLGRREQAHSRTLVAQVVDSGEPILLSDAAIRPELLEVKSVQDLALNSVLIVPLTHRGRSLGAVYLGNRSVSHAFDEGAQRIVDAVGRFSVAWLDAARLLDAPVRPGASLFLDESRAPREIVGDDPKVHALRALIDRVASKGAPVLIEGESGTGKELVARALHDRSPRHDKPFVAQNCAAIPADLLEAELFGHEKGSFTSATARRIGLLEHAQGGTLLLDEIQDLPYPMQAKLLRVLEEREFRPIGAAAAQKADVQVVATSSKPLRDLVDAGRFYDALYYRLSVVTLHVPPLRDRRDDIPILIDFFLRRFAREYDRSLTIDDEALERLTRYAFPGNVRELRNVLWRLVLLADSETIRAADLPDEIRHAGASPACRFDSAPGSLEEIRRRRKELGRLLADQERMVAKRAVEEADGNLTQAAARLGIHRVTLHRILRERTRTPHHNDADL